MCVLCDGRSITGRQLFRSSIISPPSPTSSLLDSSGNLGSASLSDDGSPSKGLGDSFTTDDSSGGGGSGGGSGDAIGGKGKLFSRNDMPAIAARYTRGDALSQSAPIVTGGGSGGNHAGGLVAMSTGPIDLSQTTVFRPSSSSKIPVRPRSRSPANRVGTDAVSSGYGNQPAASASGATSGLGRAGAAVDSGSGGGGGGGGAAAGVLGSTGILRPSGTTPRGPGATSSARSTTVVAPAAATAGPLDVHITGRSHGGSGKGAAGLSGSGTAAGSAPTTAVAAAARAADVDVYGEPVKRASPVGGGSVRVADAAKEYLVDSGSGSGGTMDRLTPVVEQWVDGHPITDAEDAFLQSASSTDTALEAGRHVKRFSKTPLQIVAALESRVDQLTSELGDVRALLTQLKAAMSL